MPTKNRKSQPDPVTGEIPTSAQIVTVGGGVFDPNNIPVLAKVKQAKDVIGFNPPAYNLKDHDELNGMDFILVRVRQSTGEFGDYILADGFAVAHDQQVINRDNACTIMTGSENVYTRMMSLATNNLLPARGTFRKSGDAWFFD